MKILLVLLALGFGVSFFYQQLQLSSLKSKLQLLDRKTNQVEVLISQTREKVGFQPAPNATEFSREPIETNNQEQQFRIESLDKKVAALEELLIDAHKSRVKFENKILSIQQELPLPKRLPLDDPKLSISERKERSKEYAREKQQNLIDKLSYEEVKPDWALPMESKITDSFAVNEALSGVDSIQAQCKTTLCEVSIFYNPTSDEDLIEFENEVLVALGENLTNVHGLKKSGTMGEGYSFTLIASP